MQSGTLSGNEIHALIDWGAEYFAGAERYPVEAVPAIDLLKATRFDLLAKVIYADHLLRGVRDPFGERLYAEHLHVWNNYFEAKPPKNGRAAYIGAFREMVERIRRGQYAPERSLVPVGRDGTLIDGAHRVGACIAAGMDVRVVRSDVDLRERQVPDYDYAFFAERRSFVPEGLSPYFSDEMALAYCRLKPTSRVVVLFPAGHERHDADAVRLLRTLGEIIYAKSFFLNRIGALQFVRHLYHFDPRGWMGTLSNGFAGARDKADRCFPRIAPCRVLIVEPDPRVDAIELKDRIRRLYGIGNDSIHIGDTADETRLVAGFVLNRNSIDFFNKARPRALHRFDRLFAQYADAVRDAGVPPYDLCVHGSAVLSAAGLRDCMDIDFLGFGDAGSRIGRPGLSERAPDAILDRDAMDAVIFDPAHHFWYWGHKFATLPVMRAYKTRRGEVPKDVDDIRRIDGILTPGIRDRMVSAYYRLLGLRTRSPRDVARAMLQAAGLLQVVRRLRR